MPADELLRADLADFTVSLSRRIEALEAKIEETRRLALDALDLAGAVAEQEDPDDNSNFSILLPRDRW